MKRRGPSPSYYATGPQLAYLRRLLDLAFSRGVSSCYDRHHLERVTRAEASGEIDRLKHALGVGGAA